MAGPSSPLFPAVQVPVIRVITPAADTPRLAIQDEPLAVPHAVVLIDRYPPAALRLTGAS